MHNFIRFLWLRIKRLINYIYKKNKVITKFIILNLNIMYKYLLII